MYKKIVTMVPSAWSCKALGDIINFVEYYKDEFEVVIISDKYDEELVYDNGVKYVKGKTSLSDYYIYTSEYLIDAGTVNRHSKIYNDQKRISVWHGTPYKKMFVDFDKKYIYTALNYQRGVDLMVSPSSFYTEKFLRDSMLYNGKVLEIGSSRMDSLFIDKEKKQKVRDEITSNPDKIVLYAPSFRKKGKFSLPFDPSKVLEALGEGYQLAVKLHYLNELDADYPDVIDLTEYSNVNEILSITDVLITDYSSLFFDYSVIGNNILLYQYDIEEYSQERGFMFEINDFIDKDYISYNESDLYEGVRKIASQDLSVLKNTFYPHEDGNTTSRIVKELNFLPENRKIRDIIFLVNELNQIGGVHNFINNMAANFKQAYNSRIIVIGIKEFNTTNDSIHFYNPGTSVDLMLSKQLSKGAVKNILLNTEGIIFSLQFSAQLAFQEYLENKNVILMFHGDSKDIANRGLYKWHLDKLNNFELFNYKKLILLSESNSNLLSNQLNKKVVSVTSFVENGYNFLGTNEFKKSNIYVSVTRLDDDKNIFDLLEIFKNEKIDSILHVYGEGPLKLEFEMKINEYKLQDKVILKGYETDKKIIYENKQGLISTSLSEGFPLVFLEAINFGVPVYTYNSFTAVNDIISDEVGKIIETGNYNQYVEELTEEHNYDFEKMRKYILKFSDANIFEKWKLILDDIDTLDGIYEPREKKVRIRTKDKIKKSILRIYRRMNMKSKLKVLNVYSFLMEFYCYTKMKAKPKISIIVPFYKNEEYIITMLDSIKKQRYSNIEVVVVNDGFDYDESDIVKHYTFIKYFKKENQGLGLTRNYGIEKSTGDYLFYLDPDDTIPRGSLTFLMSYALKNDLDLVAGKSARINFHSPLERHTWFYDIYKKPTINTKENRSFMIRDTISTNKLYKKSALIKSGIIFDEGLYEDKLYINKIYKYFDRIGIINKFVYNWMIYGKNTTITTTLTLDNFNERFERLLEIWEISDDKINFANYQFAINHDFKIYMNNLTDYDDASRKEIFDKMRCYLTSKIENYYPRNISNVFNLEYVDAIINDDFERFNTIGVLNGEVIQSKKEEDE